MNKMDERKKELIQLIKKHNDLYWNNKELEISDVEYDKLVEELRTLDPENELVTEFAQPNLSKEKLIKHSKPMLSLAKIYSKEELIKWVKKVSRTNNEEFIIQPKYDGMSGILENGTLSSRGTGEYGQDYTDKLKIVKFDSNKTITPEKDTLLGELIIRNSDFRSNYINVKSKAGIPFKNQRNGIAGILGTDDVDFYAKQGATITFVDYDKYYWETSCFFFADAWDHVVESILKNTDYPLDGIVVKLKDKIYSNYLGYTTHHPRGQVAFKFTNSKATSKLIGVEWGMGKQQISAIGLIEPVEISGITIKRVKLQLTRPKSSAVTTCLIDGSLQIGDTVEVERAGDIIPHILSSTPGENRTPVVLNKCPFCGGELEISDTSISCTNSECIESIIQDLYSSVVTLGFKNVGESYIRTLVNDLNLSVRNIADLMELRPEQLTLKEYGTRKKEIFFEEVAKVRKNASLEQVLSSVNIPNIGKTISKLLLQHFNWFEIINGSVSSDKLTNVPGIGPIIVSSLMNNLGEDKLKTSILKRLTKVFCITFTATTTCPLPTDTNKKTICFTGKMANKRSVMEEIARSKGFEPIDHVDKNLYMLVCADPDSGSSKLQKAAKYGTKIISEDDFMDGNY